MSDQRVYLDDIYASKECQGSVFRAVVMMAHEARFINKQAGQGYIQLTKKPTTIAMYKFKEGKLSLNDKASNDVSDAVVDEVVDTAPVAPEQMEQVSADADAAFGV
ncbi:MAG: hypothetical protein HUK21_11405 [Fibrobacteraceae bacterium]|nr:hypothetical protein [Fibrobacteraceae bacterium]